MKLNNLKYIPTWKIEEILADPYTRGIDGADYGPVREELENILNERSEKNNDKLIEQFEKEFEFFGAA
jgi:hypothetical protein